jgi:hypothetical protein
VTRRHRRERTEDADRGAIMVLALVFLLSVGMTIGAVLTLVGANLTVTKGLQQARSLQYAADAAIEGAIQAIRYAPPTSPPTCANFPTSGTITVNSKQLVVACSMGVPPGFYGRIVEFDACLSSNAGSFSTCQANALIQADIVYNDVKPGCAFGSTPGCYGTTSSITGGASGGSTITVGSGLALSAGQQVSGTGVAPGATVVSYAGNVVTLSTPNTGTPSGTATFGWWGTTVTVTAWNVTSANGA